MPSIHTYQDIKFEELSSGFFARTAQAKQHRCDVILNAASKSRMWLNNNCCLLIPSSHWQRSKVCTTVQHCAVVWIQQAKFYL